MRMTWNQPAFRAYICVSLVIEHEVDLERSGLSLKNSFTEHKLHGTSAR